eukprot:CAMPEP_0116132496 /NCGR_PEP_ID=MMETSP0329-20121206/9580_1 /TAXON_ID=697910 /ORGANISM="Pseudo-nitzschia arenysensis, Strain B593" /LENGTH=671 /DNA_ID=CAMNT_0003627017 /DNA_START=93 /DNA_END=2108 /DNA_ORIENTATION=-
MSGNPPSGEAPPADWRKSVLQSYRNSEVREISKVLAALEGSASVTPASKLMLAMRFEDQIFKSAKDLADYRKKISKRLKKLKKNYVAPAAAAPRAGSGAAGVAKGGSREDNTEAKAELTAKLKRDYGDQIKYIVKNARAAVEDLKKKLGPEKAKQLQTHTDSTRMWARDLEILTEEELDAIGPPVGAAQEKADETKTTADGNSKQDQSKSTMSNKAEPMSFAQLKRIEQHLKTRVANIRSYVVKHADPDQFLLETLQSKDVAFSKNTAGGNLFRNSLKGQIESLKGQIETRKERYANENNKVGDPSSNKPQIDDDEDPLLVLQKALEKSQAGVPQPTRHNNMKLEGSLRHLDKMRAASVAMMSYWMLDGDKRVSTAPRDTLKKVHEVVQEGVDFVLDAVKELEKQKKIRRYNGVSGTDSTNASSDAATESTTKLSLQDAWTKTIELPSAAPINVEDEDSSNKRPRTNAYRPYYKARMLFQPNRKTPQPLLAAIRRKGAKLKQTDCGNTNAVHLVLDFENAFTMTIYMSPLTVTVRAKPEGENNDPPTNRRSTAHWNALSHGLTPWGSTLDSSDFLRTKAQQNNNNNGNGNPEHELSVWGVTSSYDSIGRVVEERLRDASTHATAILRKCFKNHVKDKTIDFEVELLEGSALLEFLQLARSTYMPHWEDEDV